MKHFDYDVFLSFASLNESLARPLWEQLSHSGLRVFWSDETLKKKVGQRWYDVIEKSLESSKHLVLLWTPESQHSEFVKMEYQAFNSEIVKKKATDRYLIPVLVNGTSPDTLPLFLRQLQYYPLEGELKELIERVGGHYEPLREANARLRRELNQVKAEKEVLLKQLEAEQSRVNARDHSDLIAAQDALLNWQVKYDELEERYKKREAETWQAKSEVKPLLSKLQEERQAVSGLRNEKKTLEEKKNTEIRALKSDVVEKDTKIRELEDDLKSARNKAGSATPLFSLRSGIGGTVLGAVLAGIIFWFSQTGGSTQGELPVTADAQESSVDITSLIPDSVQRQITRDGIDFMYVPAGEFIMGSENGNDDEIPVHKVEISQGFYLGRTEVTQAQWESVMEEESPSRYKGEDKPVERVSWNEVQVFIDRLNEQADCNDCYRLPREAEWEYAARAGTTTAYCFGDDAQELEEYAWYGGSGGTKPVGQKKPNPLGLYDMHGNVWELVEDWFGQYENGTVIDPPGPDDGTNRVIRGGSWYNDARNLRSAIRGYGHPAYAINYVGFRLLRTIP